MNKTTMVFITGLEINYSKKINPCMGFIHLFNRDGSNFQHYSRVEAIRNVDLDQEVMLLFSISEFSMFFAKLHLIIFKKNHRILRYRRKA